MTEPTGAIEILLVEDNPRHAGLIRDELEIELPTATVTVAPSVGDARDALQSGRFDLVILDFRLPDGDGLEILRELKTAARREPVVFVTTSSSTAIAVEAMKIGAEDYIVKEAGYVSVLPFVVREVIERARLRVEHADMERRLARAERLASLNTLMAGIAHNLNNPLTTVRTFVELLPSRYQSDPEFRTRPLQAGARGDRADPAAHRKHDAGGRRSRAKPAIRPGRREICCASWNRTPRRPCARRTCTWRPVARLMSPG